MVEDGKTNQSGSMGHSGSTLSPPKKASSIKSTFYYILSIVLSILLIGSLIWVVIFIFNPVAGEYKEGVVFGMLEYVETDDSCGAWIYCYTYIDFFYQGKTWRFCNPVEFVHTLEIGKVYGFYYNSVVIGAGITSNPDYWDINLYKIVDCENNVLWEE